MSFSKLGVAKFIVSGIVGIGTGKIVGNIIKNNVTPTTLIDKVTVVAAGWVIGGLVGDATKKYTNDLIDQAAVAVTSVVQRFKLEAKLTRINHGDSTFEDEGLQEENFEQKTVKGKTVWVPKEETVAQRQDKYWAEQAEEALKKIAEIKNRNNPA